MVLTLFGENLVNRLILRKVEPLPDSRDVQIQKRLKLKLKLKFHVTIY